MGGLGFDPPRLHGRRLNREVPVVIVFGGRLGDDSSQGRWCRVQLDELERQDDRMEDWADDADDFRGDGPWRELTSSVASTARRTYEGWKRGQDLAVRACELVAKGVEHPDVKDVLSKLGSSAGGRKAIIEQLDKDARDLGSTLAGVSEDSGMGSVERAKSLLQNIERGVESLGRTPTTDKETRLILEKWPEGIRQMKEAIDDLEDLKVHQHDMDPLPEKCELKKRELQDAIAKNGTDPDGIEELPKLADAIAQPVIAGLAKAAERMKEEDDDLQRARNVSASEGPRRRSPVTARRSSRPREGSITSPTAWTRRPA